MRDIMASMLVHRAKSDPGGRASLLQTFVNERHSEFIDLPEAQVKRFFEHWGTELSELPLSLRADIMKLARPKNFSVHEQVISFEET